MTTRDISRLRALVMVNAEQEPIGGLNQGETWEKPLLAQLIQESDRVQEVEGPSEHSLWILREGTGFKATLSPGIGGDHLA